MQHSFPKHIPEQYTEHLEKAWSCILPLHFHRCLDQSRDGACVNIFRMLPKNIKDEGKTVNCQMYSIPQQETEFWDMTVKTLPNYTELMEKYNHSKHILIGVTLPITDKNNHIIGNVRLFEREMKNGKLQCIC